VTEDAVGTVRRAPEGFAHAVRLDQGDRPERWLVVDSYGPCGVETDEHVDHWPVVYTPAADEDWEAKRDE